MAVNMHDVARHAGVSQRTVSNVVTGAVRVAPNTRARVEASLAALGYRPNSAARRLRSGRTGAVTLAVPTLRERYFADLAEVFIAASRASGLEVLVLTTNGDRSRELAIIHGQEGVLTDGVVMSAIAVRGEDDSAMATSRHPLVLIGDHGAGAHVAHVAIPNRRAAHAAVAHLFRTGRRQIALVGCGDELYESGRLRELGYKDALVEAGLPLDPSLLVPCAWDFEEGRRVGQGLAARAAISVDAVFAMNDSLALGVMDGLARKGVAVPREVAIVGFDDTVEAGRARPSLTSVAPSLEEMAATALRLLEEQLEPPVQRAPAQRGHVLPRGRTGSTDPVEGGHPHLEVSFHLHERESSAAAPH